MLKKVLNIFAPFLIYLISSIIFWTSKVRYHNITATPKDNFVLALWHGNLLMIPFLYRRMRNNLVNIDILISEHRDGEIIAKAMNYFNLGSIRGSSRRSSKRVLLQAIKSIKTKDIAITPDGPKGPRYSVASGVVAIAQKSSSKVVPVSYRAKDYWTINSWDKFIIPKPFTTIDFFVGDSLDLNEVTLEEAKDIIKLNLMKFER